MEVAPSKSASARRREDTVVIAIVDYGMGNLGSIYNMLARIGASACITGDVDRICTADKLILPGVGAFDEAMQNLRRLNLIAALNERVLGHGVPILGICLGMQLLSKASHEGTECGLGWLDAETVRFDLGQHPQLRVPHMGWNSVSVLQVGSILDGLPADPRFYFVHSYHVRCRDSRDVLAVTHYGESFHSAVRRRNITGTQFHPEKSHKFGLHVLSQFASS